MSFERQPIDIFSIRKPNHINTKVPILISKSSSNKTYDGTTKAIGANDTNKPYAIV